MGRRGGFAEGVGFTIGKSTHRRSLQILPSVQYMWEPHITARAACTRYFFAFTHTEARNPLKFALPPAVWSSAAVAAVNSQVVR